jgi:hypothetical protein
MLLAGDDGSKALPVIASRALKNGSVRCRVRGWFAAFALMFQHDLLQTLDFRNGAGDGRRQERKGSLSEGS